MPETTITMKQFTGLEQAWGEASGQMGTAWDAANMDTRHGRLASSPGWSSAYPPLPVQAAVITLARFYRRNEPDLPEVLIAATADTLFAYTDTWTTLGTGYKSGNWDWVCYEDTVTVTPGDDGESEQQMVDIMLLTNPLDGMIAIYGHNLSVRPLETPDKFGFLARYKERIFGSGSLANPDSIYYSQPFNPTAWNTVEQEGVLLPELSGGRIDAPTWDGDRFIALAPYGTSLLAFKRETVFRLYGADPGEFYLRDQYGADGPIAEDTVAVDADAVYLVSGAGLSLYDGAAVRPLRRDSLQYFWAKIDPERLSLSQGALCGHRYYLSLPVAGGGWKLMELDLTRGSFMAYEGPQPTALLALGGRLLYADAQHPGQLYMLNLENFAASEAFESRWITPWNDGGAPHLSKSHFRLSGTVSLQSTGEHAQLRVTLETDRGSKTRVIDWPSGETMQPLTVRLPCYGRRFRLKILGPAGHRFILHGPLELTYYTHGEGGLI